MPLFSLRHKRGGFFQWDRVPWEYRVIDFAREERLVPGGVGEVAADWGVLAFAVLARTRSPKAQKNHERGATHPEALISQSRRSENQVFADRRGGKFLGREARGLPPNHGERELSERV